MRRRLRWPMGYVKVSSILWTSIVLALLGVDMLWSDSEAWALTPPSIAASSERIVYSGQEASLNCTLPDGSGLSCSWEQVAGVSVDLTAPESPNCSYTAPQGIRTQQTLSFRLTVTDADNVTSSIDFQVVVLPRHQVAVGPDNYYVITADGSLWAWGSYYYGQLGDGQSGGSATSSYARDPQQVGTETDWVSIACGESTVIGLKADGTLWSWGENRDGVLGDGTTGDRAYPAQMGMDTDWVAVSVGVGHALALKTDGTLWAWGLNHRGQLGTGSTTSSPTPVQIGPDTDWVSIQTADSASFALKKDGSMWGWGYVGYGIFGLGDGYTGIATDVGQYSSIYALLTPTRLETGKTWRKVDSSGTWGLSVALATDGTIWTTGFNKYGQLGNGTTGGNRHAWEQVGAKNTWVDVAAGRFHCLALAADGSLWGWGHNGDAEVGADASDNAIPSPVQIGQDTDWSAVLGQFHRSVGVKDDGSLYGWGYNLRSLITDSGGEPVVEPTRIMSMAETGSDEAIAMQAPGIFDAGASMTGVIRGDGTLWMWGNNINGQLGVGNSDPSNSTDPLQVGNASDWAGLDLGAAHVLALKQDGSLWSWGRNADGQLGLGDGAPVEVLTPNRVGNGNDWQDISAGWYHSLGLLADGSLWAWGNNMFGQLGMNATEVHNATSPRQVGSDTNWAAIAAGRFSSFGVKDDGRLYGWGWNPNSILGLDSSNATYLYSDVLPCFDQPAFIGTGFADIKAGFGHALALKQDGSLWVAGAMDINGDGQLDDTNSTSFREIGAGRTWIEIAAGGSFGLAKAEDGSVYGIGRLSYGNQTTGVPDIAFQELTDLNIDLTGGSFAIGFEHGAAVDGNGTMLTWGGNSVGQIGDGTYDFRPDPTPVFDTQGGDTGGGGGETPLEPVLSIDDFYRKFSAGVDHAQAVTTSKHRLAWGKGYLGQFGLESGNNGQYLRPEVTGNATDWAAVSAGYQFAVGLRTNGTLWSWGEPGAGRLGIGATGNSVQYTPVQIGKENTWVTADAGWMHVLALQEDGTLWAWGDSSHGQVGDFYTTDRYRPVKIGSDTDWKQISAGRYHSLALKTDGTLWAWGDNGAGQLGDGTRTDRHKPVQIGTETDWVKIRAGSNYSFAIKSDGTLWAWGSGAYGKLGMDTGGEQVFEPAQVGPGAWKDVAGGVMFGIGIQEDGSLWAWGNYLDTCRYNTDSAVPVRIGDRTDWTHVDARDSLALISNQDGQLWGMGCNNDGALGDGMTVNRSFPVQVLPIKEVLKGDCNGDGLLDLADVVLGLQILSEASRAAWDDPRADADGDNRIGLADLNFILREISRQ